MNFQLIMSVIFTLIFLFDIRTVSAGVLNAMRFCADSLVPSLLIFFVMSDLIVNAVLSNKNNKLSPKWIAFLLGSTCGFPIGSTICEAFIENGRLDKKSAEKILPFCNNTSPAFVLGAIGVSMLQNKKIGLLLYVSEIIAAFLLISVVKCNSLTGVTNVQKTDFLNDFQKSIEKAIKATLKMCGIVCFFSAFLSVITEIGSAKVNALAAMLFEIGNGVYACSLFFDKNPMLAVVLLGFTCGWSGLCVHIQIASAAKSVKVKFSRLVLYKFIQGNLTAILSVCGYKLFFCS